MRLSLRVGLASLALLQLSTFAHAVSPTADEAAAATKWVDERLGPQAKQVPFSFQYGGEPWEKLRSQWKVQRSQRTLDQHRTEYSTTFTDPQSGLQIRCEAVAYADFPTAEWVLSLKNTSASATQLVEDLQVLDMLVEQDTRRQDFVLHYSNGSRSNRLDYQPHQTTLTPGLGLRLTGWGGKPTMTCMSHFNLEWEGGGVLVSIGWPGQWAAHLARDVRDGVAALQIKAGQELTRFKLLPGEEVRTPRIALLFWRGDWIRSQNLWRRWVIAHAMPRPDGKLPAALLHGSGHRTFVEMTQATEENQIQFIRRWLEEDIKIDSWWMDAGWYTSPHTSGFEGDLSWVPVGTWEVDAKRFPNGLRPISNLAHANQIKTLLWFEPERVANGTWLSQHHAGDWVWPGSGATNGGLDFGQPEARAWITERVDQLLTDEGIDIYREDMNSEPLALWRHYDAKDRQGITEIKYVTGHLAYWDELLRRNPRRLIDNCAGGGRRLDLESMRRSVPLWRSDYVFEPVGTQCITYGLALWMPYYGSGTVANAKASYHGAGPTTIEPYAFWSNVCPSINCGFDMRVKDYDYAALRRLLGQWRRIAPYYYGDFYPLTPYSQAEKVWMAWQFDCPELGEGMVQAFRREQCAGEVAVYPLRGLDPQANYSVSDIDGTWKQLRSGRELAEQGMTVTIVDQPGAAVILYRRDKQQ